MKFTKYAVSALLSLFLLPAAGQVMAQAATLADCQSIQDRLARYACYDSWDASSGAVRQSAPARPRAEQATRAETTAPQPAATTGNAVADFGRTQSTARVVEGANGSELIAKIAALEARGPNMWIVTLDNGQRWQQMLTKRYALQIGDEVRIYPTRWGEAYRLGSERLGSYIQVKRIDGGAVADNDQMPQPGSEAPRAQEEDADRPTLFSRIFNRDEAEKPAENPAPASVDDFGRRETATRVIEGTDGKSELIDTITELEQLGPNLWLITLESGQTWTQMLSKRYALEEGDEVRIYTTRWGNSYRLSAPRIGGFIQVERVN